MSLAFGSVLAWADPLQQALVVEGAAATSDTSAALSWRLASPGGGAWLGATARGAQVREAYLDGYPVDRGTKLDGTVDASVPLARGDRLRLDLRASAGLRRLTSAEPVPSGSGSTIGLTSVAPIGTLRVADTVALRVGWTEVISMQLTPGVVTDTLGELHTVSLVTAPTPDLQLVLRTEAGGLYGYDGDGGKSVLRAAVGVSWVPGAARAFPHLQ
ncbi:MAG: hypothetical protein ABMA64_00880 [Myxococcota bacterium]